MNNKLLKNSSFSVLQTLVTAVAALLLFKFIVVHAGLKVAGLWSFLASINAITGFGSFGFANSLLFYIPKYQLEDKGKKLNSLINTAFLSVVGFTVLLCLISFIVFTIIIPHTVDAVFIQQAKQLLPFIVTAFFFSGLSASYLSVLDGLMLMHVRAKITMAGSVLFLVTGYLLLIKLGIAGIAVAQIIQNVFLLAAAGISIKKRIPSWGFAVTFDKSIFKHIFRYGFNFQVVSLAQIISDPFMKSMITRYAGMQNTAIFDFCIKLLSAFKSLLLSANQTIVPQITVYKTTGHYKRITIFYKANCKLVFFASIIFFLAPLALKDIISIFFLGYPDAVFTFILVTVSIGFLVNTIALPAHFYYLGTGNLKWTVINNIVTALIILVCTPLAGALWGGWPVIICWSVSAIAGAAILLAASGRETGIPFTGFFSTNTWILIFLILIAIVSNHFINHTLLAGKPVFIIGSLNALLLIICLAYPILKEPSVKKIMARLRRHLSQKDLGLQ